MTPNIVLEPNPFCPCMIKAAGSGFEAFDGSEILCHAV
jgi:hypothetical protein